MLRRLQANTWIGAALAAIYLILCAFWVWLYNRFWIFGGLAFLLFWIVALSTVFGRGIDAAKNPDLSSGAKMRAIIAIPLFLLAAKVVDVEWSLGVRVAARIAIEGRSAELEEAQRKAGAGQAAAIPYMEGVPDGGAALIRYAGGNPAKLAWAEQSRLVGENIYLCRTIGRSDWICWYD